MKGRKEFIVNWNGEVFRSRRPELIGKELIENLKDMVVGEEVQP